MICQVFHSAHYAGLELCPSFEEGEAWQKVFGPIFIYLNAAPHGAPYFSLWENAKAQVRKNPLNRRISILWWRVRVIMPYALDKCIGSPSDCTQIPYY